MKTSKELRERLEAVRSRMTELAQIEATELTQEQDDELRALETELETTDENGKTIGLFEDLKEAERREALRSRALNADTARATESGSQPNAWRGKQFNINTKTHDPHDLSDLPAYGEKRTSEVRARALDAVDKSTRHLEDSHKERTTRLLERNGRAEGYAEFVLLGMGETYSDAFLREMTGDDLSQEERSALRQRKSFARSVGLSDVTGVLVPAHLDTMLILANDGRTNPLRRIARQETGITNTYKSVRTSGVTHDWTAENGEVGDNAPSFENPTATAFKGTAFVPISFEAFEDARGREGDILRAIDDAVDEAEATVFHNGNGTSQPRGLVTALDANTNAEVANSTSNEFHEADVYNVYEALPTRYRNARTAWLGNLAILNQVRRFDDQANASNRGYPGFMPESRVFEYSKMDGAITAGSTDNILVVGDPDTYLIYDRLGTSVEFVQNLFGTTNSRPTGERGWLAHHRTGANLTVGHDASDTVVGWRLLQTETN